MTNILVIIGWIGTAIIGLGLYGYSADRKNDKIELNQEKEIRRMQDSILFDMWDKHSEVHLDHEKKHKDEEKQRLEREAWEKAYFDAKFDGLEKLIDSKL